MNANKTDMFPKTIGVVLGSFEEACQIEILAGITERLSCESMNLIIFVGATIDDTTSYNGSYSMLTKLISTTKLDGLLLMGGAMSSLLSPDELADFAERFSYIPLLSISSPIPNIPSLLVDNHSGIEDIVTHLIQIHDCKKIAFVCGPNNHPEAMSRLKSYEHTLLMHHIPIDQELIIPGNFSRESGELAVEILLDQKQVKGIEAFVCVDDSTAYGVLHALKERGYSIPGDIYVTGFDDITQASSSIPQLTTVRQPFYEMGKKGAAMLLARLNGETIAPYSFYPAEMIVRESCGCFSPSYDNTCSMTHTFLLPSGTLEENVRHFLRHADYNIQHSQLTLETIEKKIYCLIDQIIDTSNVENHKFWCDLRNTIYRYIDNGIEIAFWEQLFLLIYEFYSTRPCKDDNLYVVKYFFTKLHALVHEIKLHYQQHMHTEQYLHNFSLREISQKLIACFDINSILSIIEEGVQNLGINECYVGVYPHTLSIAPPMPNKADDLLLIFSYSSGQRMRHEEGSAFYSEILLSKPLSNDCSTGSYLFMPLLFRSEHFGYIIFKYSTQTTPHVYETLRSHISSGIKGAFLYQEQQRSQEALQLTLEQLEHANSELHTLSTRDELTGLLNRRGFMTKASQVFKSCVTENSPCVLFYLDLDGLKIINDTYGHQEGDFALIAMGDILRKTFRGCDVISRLGGDEFTLLTPHLSGAYIPEMINRLERALLDFNQASPYPYMLSTSIGYSMYYPQSHTTLEELMSIADKQLYRQKQLNHARGMKVKKS